ncbi:MAG: 30S ribosomal protein S6 [Candidatus Liberibacter ctenarytainae]|uniref:Small ribosomal subunit protein bS6 n=1 Tax=Candidatus Liberibacter ctenarytainae TaxID=2020335 RepID=A0A937ABN2_9HYPH|nr:30S ribosomal protein S6 [Candidatus Liberibacter ctenarytainae]
MSLYEHIFLLRQDTTTQQVKDIIEKYQNLIVENGGKVVAVNEWGMRAMAYLMDKNRKAHYIAMNISAPSDAVQEMNRRMRIDESILRSLTVSVKAHEDSSSLTIQRNDRDDRHDRPMKDRHTDRKRNFDEEKILS